MRSVEAIELFVLKKRKLYKVPRCKHNLLPFLLLFFQRKAYLRDSPSYQAKRTVRNEDPCPLPRVCPVRPVSLPGLG